MQPDDMTDAEAVELLDALARYFELYGPNGTVEQGDGPADLSARALASDLFESLTGVARGRQERLRKRLEAVEII